jgi:hypothetical protein
MKFISPSAMKFISPSAMKFISPSAMKFTALGEHDQVTRCLGMAAHMYRGTQQLMLNKNSTSQHHRACCSHTQSTPAPISNALQSRQILWKVHVTDGLVCAGAE